MCVSRGGAIFAGIFCLIEAVAWLGLSIAGLSTYNCQYKPPSDIAAFIIGIYFYNARCPPPLPLPDVFPTLPPDFSSLYPILPSANPTICPGVTINPDNYPDKPAWPEVVEPAERTARWMLAYAILSGIWIFTSLMLIIGASIGTKGCWSTFSYVPWLLTTLAVIVADTVATVTYGMDVSKTMTIMGLLEFVGILNLGPLKGCEDMERIPGVEGLSAVPSAVMTVIFARGLIFWAFNVIFLLAVTLALKNNLKRHRAESRNKQRRAGSNLWMSPSAPKRKDSTESDGGWGYSRNQPNPWQYPPRRTKEPDQSFEEISAVPVSFVRCNEEVRSSLRQNGKPPSELRNQVPWNYLNEELSRPPKPNKLAQEPMPPVPPPDYTLKFPQLARPGLTGQLGNNYRASWDSGRDVSIPPTPLNEAGPSRLFPPIPPPDYNNRRLPPKVPNRQGRVHPNAGRGYTNQGYVRGDGGGNPGYMEPHIPPPDYNKSKNRGIEDGNWKPKPLHMAPHLITRTPKRPNELGRGGEQVYY